MENKEYFKGLNYEGYYDEKGDFCIDINEKDAVEILRRISGAKEIYIK